MSDCYTTGGLVRCCNYQSTAFSGNDTYATTESPSAAPFADPSIAPTQDPTPVSDDIFISPKPMSFSDAEEYCKAFDRHLVSIHSQSAQDAAAELCNLGDELAYGCWIGLYHDDSDWKWSDGSALDYGFGSTTGTTSGAYPWYPGEPNNVNEDCVQLFPAVLGNQWNDLTCSNLCYAICKGTTLRFIKFSV